MIATAALVALVAILAMKPPAARAYDECRRETHPWDWHCYALSSWYPSSSDSVSGSEIQILTDRQSVPGTEEGNFVTNEMWDGFYTGGWVETGQESNHSTEGKGLRYFYDSDIDGEDFYHIELPNGPADKTWNTYSMQNAGGGVWYYWINGAGPYGFGGQPGATDSVEDGLEMTASDIKNTGKTEGARHIGNGEWLSGFYDSGSEAEDFTYGYNGDGTYERNNAPTCVRPRHEAGDITFKSDPCAPSASMLSEETEDEAAPHSTVVPGAVEANTNGPLLSGSQIETIADAFVRRAGDEAPRSISISTTRIKLGEAIRATQPETILPSTAAIEPWLESEAYVVDARGHFVLNDEPVPPGHASPTGSSLELVINARTGEVNGATLSK